MRRKQVYPFRIRMFPHGLARMALWGRQAAGMAQSPDAPAWISAPASPRSGETAHPGANKRAAQRRGDGSLRACPPSPSPRERAATQSPLVAGQWGAVCVSIKPNTCFVRWPPSGSSLAALGSELPRTALSGSSLGQVLTCRSPR